LTVRDTKPKSEKIDKWGHSPGHVIYFSKFGTPTNISGTTENTVVYAPKLTYTWGVQR